MATHTFHVVFSALKLSHPTSVSCSTTLVCVLAPPGRGDRGWPLINRVKYPETFPHSSIITWDFPARGELPPVRLHWYDGGLKPPRPADLSPEVTLRPEGSCYVGDKGVLLLGGTGGGSRLAEEGGGLLPAEKFKDFTPPPKTLKRTPGHYLEWIQAAKGGPPASCNFEFASLLAETALLGVVSQRTGRHLTWDADNMRFTNDTEANQYINPPYREGWSL
jgi:hypothetical protein